MLNIPELFVNYDVEPKGVIHIGAHVGSEVEKYNKMQIQKIVFIEANPEVYLRLQENIKGFPNVKIINCAINNYNGEVVLRVTSNDQSSSILPLKYHKVVYPEIKEVRQIKVQCRTLDVLMKEQKLEPRDFNFINIDIQGAELLAFQGANGQLRFVDIISSEVNFEEMYEGCVLKVQLDEFLLKYGFECVKVHMSCPSWGDALYVKEKIK